jgi:hypothetical protein
MPSKMVYQWGESYGAFPRENVPAQVVGERLEQIRAQDGDGLTPAQVLADAKPTDALLHNLFEWRNAPAANEWRLYQARHVIRALRITVPDAPGDLPKVIYANISIAQEGNNRVYMPVQIVAADAAMQEWTITNALNYLKGFQERYRHLTELGPIMDAIDKYNQGRGKP